MIISNQCKCLIHCIDIQLLENQHTVDLYCQKNIAKRLDIDQYSTAKCKGQSLKKSARKNADNRVFFQKLQHLC